MKHFLDSFKSLSFYRKMYYCLLALLIFCIIPLLIMGFYSHPVCDDYTYGGTTHAAWENTGSVFAVFKAAIETAKRFWRGYQGPFASAFFMSLHPGIISERLYPATPFIMLFMLIFSTSVLLYVLLEKYFQIPSLHRKIITCFLLLFCIELLDTPCEAFYWFCGSVHYTFMHSCMLLLISVLLLAVKKSKYRPFYIFVSVPLAICCGGANFVTALTTIILFVCAITAVLIFRKRNELFIMLPAFATNIIAFIINVTAPGNSVRQADQLTSLPPAEAIYYAFQYCLKYLGEWTNIYLIIGVLFLLPIMWTAAAKIHVRLRLPGLFTLFSFCLLSAMFAPNTYALGLVVIFGRTLNTIMQAYYLLLILNLLYWFGWFHQQMDTELMDKLVMPLKKYRKSFLIALCAFTVFAVFCTPHKELPTKSAIHDLSKGYAQAYHRETLHRIALLSMEGVDEVWVPNYTVRPYLLDIEDISTDPTHWHNAALAAWYGKEIVHLSVIY